MTDPAAKRAREELEHDLEILYEKRRRITVEQRRPPTPPLRVFGLMMVFAAALAWYTATDLGLTIGVIVFVIGCLLMIIPRGATLSALFTRPSNLVYDDRLNDDDPQAIDDRISALESSLERIKSRLDG